MDLNANTNMTHGNVGDKDLQAIYFYFHAHQTYIQKHFYEWSPCGVAVHSIPHNFTFNNNERDFHIHTHMR